MLKPALVGLLTWSIVTVFCEARAAPLPPLSEITPIGQAKIYFDPTKVTAVFPDYLITVTPGHNHGLPDIHKGPLKPHVSGVGPSDFPIETDGPTFLTNLHLLDKFVELHGIGGSIYLKAASVASVSSPGTKVIDPRIKTFVYPGLAGPGGSKEFWQVFETPEQVKQLVDAVRSKPDAAG
jgi:hypothetical protein